MAACHYLQRKATCVGPDYGGGHYVKEGVICIQSSTTGLAIRKWSRSHYINEAEVKLMNAVLHEMTACCGLHHYRLYIIEKNQLLLLFALVWVWLNVCFDMPSWRGISKTQQPKMLVSMCVYRPTFDTLLAACDLEVWIFLKVLFERAYFVMWEWDEFGYATL